VAVSPLRALLTAQLQAVWNRLQREGGEASVVAGGIVALVAAVAIAPPVGGSFFVGRSLGRGLATGDALVASATGFQALLLGAAVLGGLLEHRLAYSVEGFRLYPIPRLSLLGAELIAGLLNLLALLAGLCSLAMAVGLSVGAPRATPLFLLIAVQGLVWIALVQHGAAVAKRLLAGSRVAVAAFVVVLVALITRVGPETGRGLQETIRAIARALSSAVQILPFSVAYRGAQDVLQGRFVAGSLRQLAMIAATAALFGLVALAHFAASDTAARGGARKAERLWSYRSPIAAMARLFQDQVLASREGRIALFIPLLVSLCLAVTIVGMAELQAKAAREPLPFPLRMVTFWEGLPLVGILLVFLPTMDDLWLNQFGLDGPAIRGLLLLPLRPEQILLARTLGLIRVHALKVAIGVGPLLLMQGRPALVELAWGVAASFTVLLVIAGCGHVISARFPRRVREGAFLSSSATPLTAFVIPPAVQLPTFATLIIVYKLFAPLGPWGPAFGMWLLLVVAAIGYWRALPFLAARVMDFREHLVEELA
jgi:hypothetical protein